MEPVAGWPLVVFVLNPARLFIYVAGWSQMQISGADPSTKQLVTLTKVLIGLTILLVIGVGVQI
ncbi:MAG: hypothetical protein DMG74_20990 [Acidobacteria bacterium]|nr:MAG: hypothetical protein DMG85_22150 [Acidobacteriota bacterium]PYX62415.1 MAG: hypothetical protein DMG74_20990 [Acidobacteriota bacterium]